MLSRRGSRASSASSGQAHPIYSNVLRPPRGLSRCFSFLGEKKLMPWGRAQGHHPHTISRSRNLRFHWSFDGHTTESRHGNFHAPKHLLRFPKLPQDIQNQTWEVAIQDREDRYVRVSIECVNPSHNAGLDPDSRYDEVIHGNGISLRTISMKGRSKTEHSLTGDEGMSLCERYVMIGSPRPKHSLTQSKDLTEIDPSDQVPSTLFCGAHFLACTAPANSHESSFPPLICTRTSGMGGLFDQERDVVLLLPEKPRKTPEGWSATMCRFLTVSLSTVVYLCRLWIKSSTSHDLSTVPGIARERVACFNKRRFRRFKAVQ